MFVLSVIVILILFGLFNLMDMYLKDELKDEKGKPKKKTCLVSYLIKLIAFIVFQNSCQMVLRRFSIKIII